MRYKEEYKEKMRYLDLWKVEVERNVADIIRYHCPTKKLTIGNMVYGVLGNMVTYCYLADVGTDKEHFYPIWDRDEMGDFGWSDFSECCGIYDVICNTLIKTNSNGE